MDFKKILSAPFLIALGLLVLFASQAALVGGFLKFLAPLATYGALLIVIGAVMQIIEVFK